MHPIRPHLKSVILANSLLNEHALFFSPASLLPFMTFLNNLADVAAHFFELGGHSLLAMRLAMALRCDVRTIMVNPTVSSLLEHLSDNVDAIDTAMDALIETLAESDSMTKHEQRILFMHLLDPNSNSYNMPFHVQFRKSIDVRANLAVVLESLSILRTRFADGKATSDVAVNIANLQEGDIDVFAPFVLERGPLCRFAVDEKKYIVKGSIHHHSIADGRSMVWRCCSRRFVPVSIDGDGN